MIASSIASIFIATLVLSTSAAGAPIDRRSEYPPDYILTTDCKRDGPVEVCSLNRNTASSRLVIRYHKSGYLWPQASPLSAYVNFNGIQATFGNFTADTSIANAPVSAEYVIGAYRDLHWCYHATTADNSSFVPDVWSAYGRCPVTEKFPLLSGGVGEGRIGYFYYPAPEIEQSMVNQTQAWNVQVAVFNQNGKWDSKYGANYRFTL